jgi:predicted transcriptional regulator
MEEDTRIRLIELTADVVSAYVSNNPVPVGELGSLISKMHQTLAATASGIASTEAPKEPQHPAVPIKKSVQPEYIVSLEDGRKFRSLKRHLMTHYGMTPDQYRAKWGLPADYPMVAPNYSTARSEMARSMGLGRKAAPPPPPEKRGRKNGPAKAPAEIKEMDGKE